MPTVDTMILLAVACINAFVAVVAWRTKQVAERTETNTNHMREQLVTATGKAAHAAGREEMRGEAKGMAEDLADDQREAETAVAMEKVASETKRIADVEEQRHDRETKKE